MSCLQLHYLSREQFLKPSTFSLYFLAKLTLRKVKAKNLYSLNFDVPHKPRSFAKLFAFSMKLSRSFKEARSSETSSQSCRDVFNVSTNFLSSLPGKKGKNRNVFSRVSAGNVDFRRMISILGKSSKNDFPGKSWNVTDVYQTFSQSQYPAERVNPGRDPPVDLAVEQQNFIRKLSP